MEKEMYTDGQNTIETMTLALPQTFLSVKA